MPITDQIKSTTIMNTGKTTEASERRDGPEPKSCESLGAEMPLPEANVLLEALMANSLDYIYFKDRQSRFIRHSRSSGLRFSLTEPDALRGKTDFDLFSEEHARPAYEDEQRIIRTGEPIIGKLESDPCLYATS